MEEHIQISDGKITSSALLSDASVNNLRLAAPWMKFLSILGFIFCVLLLMAGIGAIIGANYGDYYYNLTWPIAYFVSSIIILFPNLYLYNASVEIKRYIDTNDTVNLETAFLMQKKFWKFLGIVAIIYLSLCVLALIIYTVSQLS